MRKRHEDIEIVDVDNGAIGKWGKCAPRWEKILHGPGVVFDSCGHPITMHGRAGEVLEDEAGSLIEVELEAVDGPERGVLMLDAGLVEPGTAVEIVVQRGPALVLAGHRPHAQPRWR